MIALAQADVERLFERHGIHMAASEGTADRAAAAGGRIATVEVGQGENGERFAIQIGRARASRQRPLDERGAAELVEELQREGAIPSDDARFANMLQNLLLKISIAFEDSGARSLTVQSLHLHPASYHVGRVFMLGDAPLHVAPRREAGGEDRRETALQHERPHAGPRL